LYCIGKYYRPMITRRLWACTIKLSELVIASKSH
jgi:hypothetical protein